MKKYISEFLGTALLVLIGCGTAVIAGDEVGVLGIAISFGLAIIVLSYSIGPISGGHVNPAVTLGAFINKRISSKDAAYYVVAQILGGFLAILILKVLVSDPQSSLGANRVIEGVTLQSAILFEIIFTFIFVFVILQVTKETKNGAIAGIVIGMSLIAMHLVGIKLTGTSLNPARSIAPALLGASENGVSDLWIFITMPLIGGALAGLLSNYFDE